MKVPERMQNIHKKIKLNWKLENEELEHGRNEDGKNKIKPKQSDTDSFSKVQRKQSYK